MRFTIPIALVSATLAISGCPDGAAPQLLVALRTDHVPGLDFAVVRNEVFEARPSAASERYAISEVAAYATLDYVRGERIAEFTRLRGAGVWLRTTLLASGGVPIASRVTHVVLHDRVRTSVTVVITRDCRGIECPGSGDDPGATSCLDGRCVDPECTPETPEACDELGCTIDTDCTPPAASCAHAVCLAGVCLDARDDAACGGGVCDPELGCVGGFTDGGPRDAGPADAGTSVPCGAGVAGLLFCNGFEPADTPWTASMTPGGSSLDIQETRVHSGRFALAAHLPVAPAPADFIGPYHSADVLGGATSGDVYVRAWFWIPTGAPLDRSALVSIERDPTHQDGSSIWFGGIDGALGVRDGAAGAKLTSVAAPRDRWFCAELHIRISTAVMPPTGCNGLVEYWVDGTSIDSRQPLCVQTPGGFRQVFAGVPYGWTPADVWIDDVVVATSRIGCAAM